MWQKRKIERKSPGPIHRPKYTYLHMCIKMHSYVNAKKKKKLMSYVKWYKKVSLKMNTLDYPWFLKLYGLIFLITCNDLSVLEKSRRCGRY